MMTARPPRRSSTWPQNGWAKPLTSTCSAIAKAKPLAGQAWAAVIGAKKRRKLWRRPMPSAAVRVGQPTITPMDVRKMPDRRGHGRSSQTWDGNDLGTYPGDLAERVSQFDLRDAIRVGRSKGDGEVTGFIVRQMLSRVAKAVLVGADSAPSSTGVLAAR